MFDKILFSIAMLCSISVILIDAIVPGQYNGGEMLWAGIATLWCTNWYIGHEQK